MEVTVHGKSNIEMAIRAFRKKAQKEGVVKEARRRKAAEKPSIKKKRKAEDNIARRKKARKGEYSF
jgi:small subunit ribosomal protein S21